MAFVQVKKCLKDPKQLVKLIALVVCICITIYQLSECVSKIVSPPITSYYKFVRNETLKYPALTICRKPAYKTDLWPSYGIQNNKDALKFSDSFKNFIFNNTTVNQFLEETSYSFKEMSSMISFGNVAWGENLDTTPQFFLDRGACHKIVPKVNSNEPSVGGGYYFYLKHDIKTKTRDSYGISTSGFEIYIHEYNDVITESIYGSNEANFVYLESAEEMQVTLSMQSFSQISTAHQPCESAPNYSISKCKEKCFHNIVAKQAGCTTLWLRDLDHSYPECSDNESTQRLISAIQNLKNKAAIEQCGCINACNSTIFGFSVEQRNDADLLLGASSTINLYFKTNLLVELTEVISYDWNTFLSDVGGSLGFLLGLSVIGFINILEQSIKIICSRKGKNKDSDSFPKLQQAKDLPEDSLKTVAEFVANCEIYQQSKEKETGS